MVAADVTAMLRDSLPFVRPQAALERLVTGARVSETAPGEHLYREGDGTFIFLVLHGLVRTYMSSPGGRQITVRYPRAGELVGLGSLFTGGPPLSFQALTTTRALHLRPEAVDATARTDPRVAYAIAAHSSLRLVEFQREIGRQAFLSVRARVARHLLDLATPSVDGPTVKITQQELADAVGTAREVVARAIAQLRSDGLIGGSRGEIQVLDAEALHSEMIRS
jgi:CRP/FNR family transcriptional regulator